MSLNIFAAAMLLFGASPNSLLPELQEKSASEGLVIAGVINRNFKVFPFSGPPLVLKFFEYDLGLARSSPDGRGVLGYSGSENTGVPANRIALIQADGRVAKVLNRDVINIADMAIDPKSESVVVAGEDLITRKIGIFVGHLGSDQTQLTVPLKSISGVVEYTALDWIPGASAFLFSRNNKVFSYDLGLRQETLLYGAGSNPSCSPDGRWVAYCSSSGYAMVASRGAMHARRASLGRISGRVHWSPDSEYFFVAERVRGSSPEVCPFGSCFVVYRVRDYSRVVLAGTNLKDSFFGWFQGAWPIR